MGRGNELGRLQPGMLADLLVLDSDPLADIRNTENIVFVIKGGQILHCDTKILPAGCPE
jgi:imidazolonepropionase-like amidohydrolase